MWFSNKNIKQGTDEHVIETDIVCDAVVERIRNNTPLILLDVRTREEYAEKHLNQALLLPVEILSAETLASIGIGDNSLEKEIIVYCRSGVRGAAAHDALRRLGYKNVKNLAGGIISWESAGHPVVEEGEYAATLEEA